MYNNPLRTVPDMINPKPITGAATKYIQKYITIRKHGELGSTLSCVPSTWHSIWSDPVSKSQPLNQGYIMTSLGTFFYKIF